jgi:hypothetical protein
MRHPGWQVGRGTRWGGTKRKASGRVAEDVRKMRWKRTLWRTTRSLPARRAALSMARLAGRGRPRRSSCNRMQPALCGGHHWPVVLELPAAGPARVARGMRRRAVADSAAGHVGGVARCILALFPEALLRPGIGRRGPCAASSDPSLALRRDTRLLRSRS